MKLPPVTLAKPDNYIPSPEELLDLKRLEDLQLNCKDKDLHPLIREIGDADGCLECGYNAK